MFGCWGTVCPWPIFRRCYRIRWGERRTACSVNESPPYHHDVCWRWSSANSIISYIIRLCWFFLIAWCIWVRGQEEQPTEGWSMTIPSGVKLRRSIYNNVYVNHQTSFCFFGFEKNLPNHLNSSLKSSIDHLKIIWNHYLKAIPSGNLT